MPTVNVDIQPEIITWALRQAKEEQLGTKLMNHIEQWLSGTKTPTFHQIETFSKKANIPLGYFFLETPPREEVHLLEYRTIDSVDFADPSRNLIETIQEMERIQDWMKDYRQDTGFDTWPVVGSLKGYTNVKQIANVIRKDMSLSIDWYNNCSSINESFHYIRNRLEQCGIIIMLNGVVGKNTHRLLNIDEFRAFAMIDKWAPLIFINSADSQGARLFSLFHEAIHIWLGADDLYNDRRNRNKIKPIEVICNAVAGELMVPDALFDNIWNQIKTSDALIKISNLSKTFKCGDSVIARKALDHRYINQNIYDNVVNNAIEAYKIRKESNPSDGGNYYNTMGSRLDGCFVKALCESIQSGRTSYTEAYRLTNTSRKTFDEIAARLGGAV